MYPGAIKHIKKKHPHEFSDYFKNIPEIIESPDYVGVHPSEPNSIEFVKILKDNVLVAVKLSPKGYLYLFVDNCLFIKGSLSIQKNNKID